VCVGCVLLLFSCAGSRVGITCQKRDQTGGESIAYNEVYYDEDISGSLVYFAVCSLSLSLSLSTTLPRYICLGTSIYLHKRECESLRVWMYECGCLFISGYVVRGLLCTKVILQFDQGRTTSDRRRGRQRQREREWKKEFVSHNG
jgi:hypothetical protein